jgi:hypothetical protein
MNARFRNLDPKARRLTVLGNATLVVAIGVWNFARPAGGPGHAVLDALCGLLFGISIGANLAALRLKRRCGENRA